MPKINQQKYLTGLNFSYTQYFTPRFKSKYNEEIILIANKAKNQGFEIFNG
jgi:hypothetical protein